MVVEVRGDNYLLPFWPLTSVPYPSAYSSLSPRRLSATALSSSPVGEQRTSFSRAKETFSSNAKHVSKNHAIQTKLNKLVTLMFSRTRASGVCVSVCVCTPPPFTEWWVGRIILYIYRCFGGKKKKKSSIAYLRPGNGPWTASDVPKDKCAEHRLWTRYAGCRLRTEQDPRSLGANGPGRERRGHCEQGEVRRTRTLMNELGITWAPK